MDSIEIVVKLDPVADASATPRQVAAALVAFDVALAMKQAELGDWLATIDIHRAE